jgi:hypothetical protein
MAFEFRAEPIKILPLKGDENIVGHSSPKSLETIGPEAVHHGQGPRRLCKRGHHEEPAD